MNVLFGNWIIKMVDNISKSDLDRFSIHNYKSIRLGEDSYWERIFLLDISSVNNDSRLLVPVFSGSSINPSVMITKSNQLTVGFNRKIVIIDLAMQQIILEKELPHNFIYAQNIDDKLVVIYEIGIVILNSEYQEIFHRPTDIIEKFEILGNQIIYKTYLGTEEVDIGIFLTK